MAAIGFSAPTHHILITIHLLWQDYINTLLIPVTLSSAEHGRWKEPIRNRSVGDSSKDVSPRPLLLSWLCLHKCGGVYLRCQDQCWPRINNILRTCTLTAYRLGNINLSHPPCFGDSALLLTPPLHFSLIVKLMAIIFSRVVVDTLFIWWCVLRLPSFHPSSPPWPSLGLLFSYHASSVRRRRGHNLGPPALPVISTAVNIFWTSPFPGWNGNKSHPNNSVPLFPRLWLQLPHLVSTQDRLKQLIFLRDLVLWS